jgi:hypothetical protein
MQKNDYDIEEIRHFFRRKLAKIGEISHRNIDHSNQSNER